MGWSDAIAAHYQRNWRSAGVPCRFARGPVRDLLHDFEVLAFPPREGRRMWSYATRGMSQPADRRRLELHMFCPWEDDGVVELLVATAYYHRTGAALDLWHTVNFGRPWLNKSSCDHGRRVVANIGAGYPVTLEP